MPHGPGLTHTLVFYVPPHDLLAVLKDAAAIFGSHRQCVIARELTKVGRALIQLAALASLSCLSSVCAL